MLIEKYTPNWVSPAGTSVHQPRLFEIKQNIALPLVRRLWPVPLFLCLRHKSMQDGTKKAQIKLGWGKRAQQQSRCRVLSKRPGRPTNPSFNSLMPIAKTWTSGYHSNRNDEGIPQNEGRTRFEIIHYFFLVQSPLCYDFFNFLH